MHLTLPCHNDVNALMQKVLGIGLGTQP